MKIGILGGTFNPPHNGHVKLVTNILDKGLVDKVIILPTNNKYRKTELINVKHRINMLNLCYANDGRVVIEDEDVIKSLDYTYKALDYYKQKFEDSEVLFVMGSDNLREFTYWQNWEYIVKNYGLIVTIRNDDKIEDLKKIVPNANIKFVSGVSSLSSTRIRSSVKENINISEYVDNKVLNYIEKNNLYK